MLICFQSLSTWMTGKHWHIGFVSEHSWPAGEGSPSELLIRPAWSQPICKVVLLLSASGPAILSVALLWCAMVVAHGWALGNHASQKMQCILKVAILARLKQAALGAQAAGLCSAVELGQAAWKAFHSFCYCKIGCWALQNCWPAGLSLQSNHPGDAQQVRFGVARGQLPQCFQDSMFPAI